MNEVEVLILDIDRKLIEPNIVKLGLKKMFEGRVESLLFDFEDKSISNKNDLLRLRKTSDKTTLTFKHFVSDEEAKICKENEVQLSNFDETKTILELLGLKQIDSYEKQRTIYKNDEVVIEFNKLEGYYSFIPEFLEIESDNIEIIFKYAQKLGFRKEDCKPWSGEKLIGHYKNG